MLNYTEFQNSTDPDLTGSKTEEDLESSKKLSGPVEQQIQPYTRIMADWDPLPQLAGKKRTLSPESQIM